MTALFPLCSVAYDAPLTFEWAPYIRSLRRMRNDQSFCNENRFRIEDRYEKFLKARPGKMPIASHEVMDW